MRKSEAQHEAQHTNQRKYSKDINYKYLKSQAKFSDYWQGLKTDSESQ